MSPAVSLAQTGALHHAGAQLAARIDAVVIGTSAGGVEALSQILPAVPATLHAAIMIVLHIPRDRPSLLPEIFAAKCTRPVREAMDKEPIEPGTIYFAPPDYHLLVDEGPQLALSVDELVNFSRPAIDVLFESAADIYRERLLGIVLTGANDDGAAGLATVHRLGGVAIVQQPASALVSFMPESAVAATPAAMVLSLQQIASLLSALGKENRSEQQETHSLDSRHARN